MTGGYLYESTGIYGASSLRQIDPVSGKIIQKLSLDRSVFGEGIAVINKEIFMLTWKEHTAFIFSLKDMTIQSQLRYVGEGWGLCSDGDVLVMSNGSDRLLLRNPKDFKIIKNLPVKLKGKPLKYLNDLACAKNRIYANIWPTNWIAEIDRDSGDVITLFDCSALVPKDATSLEEDVLNGIAYNSETDTFYITEKRWPWIYEVKLKETRDSINP